MGELTIAQVGNQFPGTAELLDGIVQQPGKGINVFAGKRVDVAGAQVGEHRIVKIRGFHFGDMQRVQVPLAVRIGAKHFGKNPDTLVNFGGQLTQQLKATRIRREKSKLHENTTGCE